MNNSQLFMICIATVMTVLILACTHYYVIENINKKNINKKIRGEKDDD